MDIIVRKVEGKIVVVSGESRLDAELNTRQSAVVKFLGSGKKVYVSRDQKGNLIEFDKTGVKEEDINFDDTCTHEENNRVEANKSNAEDYVSKWIDGKNFKEWESANKSQLKHEYENYKKKSVDLCKSYEEYCGGIWTKIMLLKQLGAVDNLLEKTANEFFKGKNKAHTSPISYGELVWVMRSLLTEAQTLPIPLEPFADHSQLVNKLWESDAACALTNQAARVIEKLSTELQKAVNDRNAAWFQLEEAGIQIVPDNGGE